MQSHVENNVEDYSKDFNSIMAEQLIDRSTAKPTLFSYVVYVLAAAFLFYEMALQVSPSVITHQLMRDLHIDAGALGMMAGIYFYSYTPMQIPAGLLFDRYSPRFLIVISLSICVLGAFFFGMAHTVFLASVGRLLMGIGSAFAFIGVLVVTAQWFPPSYFAFMVGIAQLLAAAGAMGGEVPLAAAVTKFGWRETINAIGIAGIILAVLIWLIIRDKPPFAKTAESSGTHKVFESLRIVLGNSQTWWVALYAFCGWAPVSTFASLWGIPYLMAVYGISNTLAASAVAMVWIGMGIASPIIGWCSDQIGRRCLLMDICVAIGLISSIIILYVPHIPFSVMFVLLFAFGVATAGQILSFAVAKDNNRPTVVATAIGFNNMAVVAGGALFQPLVGMLLRWNWNGKVVGGIPVYSMQDYRIALFVVPACFLVGLIASRFLIQETYCRARW